MIAKLIIYAVLFIALAILISSTTRIALAVFPAFTSDNFALINGVGDDEEDISNDQPVYNTDPPILPINQRKFAVKMGEKGPKGVSDVLPRLFQLPRRTIDPAKLPYKCGVILIQHQIPGDEGAAIDDWIRGIIDSNDDSGAAYISSTDAGSREAFLAQINEQIEMKGEFYWTVLGSGEHGLSLASDGDVLHKLRENMKERGCQLVAMSMFSEPLDYSMKQTRQMFARWCKNCDVTEFTKKLESDSDVNWRGQLDYFLYNNGEIESYNTTAKVKDAITKLREHYDLVLLDGKDDFSKEILKVTGWKSPDGVEIAAEVNDMEIGGLRYSKHMVKQYTKFDAKNGDADFYDALHHIYHSDLAFLFNQ
mmetsp:Transcript_18420/g.26152  ORF Transcript_18420/g.26152 Transcript_18420/m.26152 type:complete len:365 (-) Transcript_18420:75-1169(-)